MSNDPDSSSPDKHTIQLDFRCKLEDSQINGLIRLLDELIPFTLADAAPHLHSLIVVSDGEVERTVNKLIRDVGKRSETYSAGQHVAGAVAVPIEVDSALSCFIVLSSSHLKSVRPEKYHPFTLVSSLLEELLHTRVYSTVWQQRGTIFPRMTNLWERDVFTMCNRFHDEYIVGRMKAAIASSMPLFDVTGGLSPGAIFYPNRISTYLESATEHLIYLITEISTGRSTAADACYPILNVIYRYVFEPLARDAGFRAGNTEQSSIPWDANETILYRNIIEPYWLSIKNNLENSFSSNLQDTDKAQQAIIDDVTKLLQELGLFQDGHRLRYIETPFLKRMLYKS